MNTENLKLIDGIMVRECRGCGWCCIQTPCDLARRLNPSIKSECTFLKWDNDKNRYVCGAYTNAKFSLQTQIKAELFIGAGCCSGLNSWRKDIKPRRDKDIPEKTVRIKLDPIFKAFLHSLKGGFISGDAIYLTVSGTINRLIEDGTYSKDEANEIRKEIVYILNDRPKFMEDFMG